VLGWDHLEQRWAGGVLLGLWPTTCAEVVRPRDFLTHPLDMGSRTRESVTYRVLRVPRRA